MATELENLDETILDEEIERLADELAQELEDELSETSAKKGNGKKKDHDDSSDSDDEVMEDDDMEDDDEPEDREITAEEYADLKAKGLAKASNMAKYGWPGQGKPTLKMYRAAIADYEGQNG